MLQLYHITIKNTYVHYFTTIAKTTGFSCSSGEGFAWLPGIIQRFLCDVRGQIADEELCASWRMLLLNPRGGFIDGNGEYRKYIMGHNIMNQEQLKKKNGWILFQKKQPTRTWQHYNWWYSHYCRSLLLVASWLTSCRRTEQSNQKDCIAAKH